MATSETVRVIVRCRPMNQRELDLKCQTIVSMDAQLNQVMLENIEQSNEPPKQFTFDAVYQEDSITENIYTESVFPLVESVLEGYNATVFAYGQTGCGKSFTMQGVNTPGSLQRGVIPRSFEHIFEASAVTTGTKYLIRASYLEIYNESIRDLLGKDVKVALDLKEYVDKGVQIQNLTWHQCSSVVDCERLMDKGNRNRATGATLMNKDSSRSHSIFTVITEMCTRSQLDGKEHIRAGKLNLVDLAGSERQSKTHAEGDRLREATRINLSLSALGNVISALVDGRSKHIPYRDSKLTRLLQDSLGGNTKTLMIAAISPAHDNYDETLSTLRYANRAKNIKNKPRINEDPRDAQMKLLQDEINRLKQELLNAGNPSRGNQLLPSDTNIPQIDQEEEIEKERERLRIEFEREVSEIRRQCENERLTKEELQRKYDDLKVQYDTELDALNANLNKEDIPSSSTTNERNKTKKKGGNLKQKPDGENLTNSQDTDENIPPSPTTNERNKTKKKGGSIKQRPDGENLTNDQDIDEDFPPSLTTNERNKTKKKGGSIKQRPDGENLTNDQDIDEDFPPSPTTNERNKTKKKGGSIKQRPDGENLTNGQDIDEDISPSPTTNERNKTKKKGGSIKQRPDGENLTNDQDIDEDFPPSPTTNERNKTKKKGGNLKRKPDGENLTNDQDIDEDNTSIPSDQLDQKQKLERLQELENKLVGGEEANNEERKKKRKKKLNDMREKLERRKRFNNAINADDDDTMMRVFDNAQEQLHFTSKKLSEQQIENKRLKNDNEDLQHEFQREREGYLNIIREQEKKLLLYRTIIDKMSNLMQRSCNYSNIEKIIEQSRYDEDKNLYHVPEPTREEVQFPQMGNLPIATNGRTIQTDYIVPSKSTPTSTINEYEDDFIVPDEYSNTNTNTNSYTNTEELEKRYVRNIDSPNGPRERTRIKRQEQLLNENAILQRTKRPFHMNDNDYMNRRLNPYDAPARLSRKYGFSSDKQ